jgi:hypothetical protein
MPVKLIGKTVDFLMDLLYKAVEARTKALEVHGNNAERLLKEQRKAFELARRDLELAQAEKAIKLYKSLDEAKKALSGISK